MILFDDIIRISKIHPSRIEGCILFGSRVYGCYNKNSDYDIILIAKNSVSNIEIKNPIYNIHIIVPSDFDKLLEDNNIKAIEVYCAPDFAIIKKYRKFNFK
jgi:predicted nucleotidyltransferase